MALRDRKINNFVELWCPVASGDLDIWVSSTSFQKLGIGWPQQPPTSKVPKFNLIFHDSNKKYLFSKHQNKAEFRNLDDFAVISGDFPGLRTFAASMTSTASTTSVASMTSTASFHQKNYWSWWFEMTNTSPFLWNGSSKIHFFTDIWYPFCRRLLRSANVIFLKTGWWNSNVQTSWSH